MNRKSEQRAALFILNDSTAPRLNPELAKEIGLNESLLFLQLEFWLRQSGTKQEDGQYWIYESVTDIQSVFSFWSRATVNRIIHSLVEKELLKVGNFNKHRYDKTRWFTLNREGIDKLNSVRVFEWWVSQNETGSAQNETRSTQNGTTIPDLSSDLSSDEEGAIAPHTPADELWPDAVAALGEEEQQENPAEVRLRKSRAKIGADPFSVAAHCKQAQGKEGEWTVPSYYGLSSACAAYRRVFEFSPQKYQRKTIDDTVNPDDQSIRFWEEICQDIADLGWSPKNIGRLLKFYVLGVLPSSTLNEGKGGNGRHDRSNGGQKQQAQEQAIQAAMDEIFDPVTGKRKELM